ncbi:hypothetical protein [Streptomyces sp. NPDC001165]|uniref:hypothetical protein n=1 Tax=Streptomyces sp. NPDC001165 TaxID=3364546 RepID=UPI0036D13C4E
MIQIVVEHFLDELETDGVGRGNQVDIFRVQEPDRHDGGVRLVKWRGALGEWEQWRG